MTATTLHFLTLERFGRVAVTADRPLYSHGNMYSAAIDGRMVPPVRWPYSCRPNMLSLTQIEDLATLIQTKSTSLHPSRVMPAATSVCRWPSHGNAGLRSYHGRGKGTRRAEIV